jgi:hypothetical protein
MNIIELAKEAGFGVVRCNERFIITDNGEPDLTVFLTKFAELLQASEPVAYADYERGTCHLIGTPIPKDEIKNPLFASPPNTEAEIDKAREALLSAKESIFQQINSIKEYPHELHENCQKLRIIAESFEATLKEIE